MTKDELVEVIKGINIPWNEGVSSEKNNGALPRVIFWEFLWENMEASGETFSTNVTYQISFYSSIARDPKLLTLLRFLDENGVTTSVNHEFVEEDKIYHSFMAIEVVEDVIFKNV